MIFSMLTWRGMVVVVGCDLEYKTETDQDESFLIFLLSTAAC